MQKIKRPKGLEVHIYYSNPWEMIKSSVVAIVRRPLQKDGWGEKVQFVKL